MKIDWEIFFGNSSTEDALAYFAKGQYSFRELHENTNYFVDNSIIAKMMHLGYKKSRIRARKALNRRGFHLNDWMD